MALRSDGCLPNWIDDEECDELCHNEACGYDGTDCGHETGGCYIEPNGLDYRGNLAQTRSGHTCQLWSHQSPQVHTYTHLAYPHAGLGGHNYCRNPGGSQSHPWCYTTNPSVPWELCDVGPPSATSASCGDNKLITSSEGGHNNNPTQRYRTLCPIDCDAVLGNKVCDLRCNISSCAYDAGDCGVGKDILSILSDQGYAQHTSPHLLLSTHPSTALTPHTPPPLSHAFFAHPPPPPPSSFPLLLHSYVVETPLMSYVTIGLGVLFGVGIGLLVLRCTLARLRKEEVRRRGYTLEEQKGIDNFEIGDDDDA